MAEASDPGFALAHVYAASMLQLAETTGDVDLLGEELAELAKLGADNAELRLFFTSPLVDNESRGKAIEKMFRGRYSDLFVDSLQIIRRKGRLDMIETIAEAYRLAREAFRREVEAHVFSAIPLTDELRERIRQLAENRTGMNVQLIAAVDESVIGGLVIRIDDEKLDASVSAKLKRLGDALRERGSKEIHSGRSYTEGAAA